VPDVTRFFLVRRARRLSRKELQKDIFHGTIGGHSEAYVVEHIKRFEKQHPEGI